jgi:hypothetical protein
VESGTLVYPIAIDGRRIILLGSMNYVESESTGLRPDVGLIGAMPDYTPLWMRPQGKPRRAIPTHWHRANVTYRVVGTGGEAAAIVAR